MAKTAVDTVVDPAGEPAAAYRLEDQIGFKLRLANQRHLEIFAEIIPELTPTQFAIMARLQECGETSQNRLGRMAGMDAATTKGVVDRLARRGFVQTRQSDTDKRRLLVFLTPVGLAEVSGATERAREVTARTLLPLSVAERRRLLALLDRLA